jgi:hypothetical protein
LQNGQVESRDNSLRSLRCDHPGRKQPHDSCKKQAKL